MKTLLVVGLCLLLVTFAAPTASAVDCGPGSLVNKVQTCANALADYGQEVVYDVYCDVACPTP